MKLSEAIEYFDTARAGEVAASTRRWFYWRDLKTGTHGGKLWNLLESLGDVEISTITIDQLRRWRSTLIERDTRWAASAVRDEVNGGLSQDGLRNYIRAARQFFKWLEDEGLIDTSPARRLPVPPPSTEAPKAIAVRDAVRILETARFFAVRDMAYWRLYQDTGAKIGELDRLTMTAVSARSLTISRRAGKGTYKPVTLTFGDDTAVSLAAWLEVRPNDGLLFTNREGEFPYCVRGNIAFGVRNYAIAQTLASSAARAGGVAGMLRERLQLGDGTAVVWEKGKGGFLKSRLVFLDDEAAGAIRDWLAIHPGNETLFPGIHGPMTRDGIYQVMESLAKEAGVSDRTNPHAWRHAWSLEALRNGADVTTVARVLGNQPQTVMNSYARWANTDIQHRHRQFSWKTNLDGNGRNGHH